MKTAIVLGAGSWGTTLAAMLAERGLKVQFWGRDEALMSEMARSRRNPRYVSDLLLPESITTTHRLDQLQPADLVVFVVPSPGIRAVGEQLSGAGVLQGQEVLLSCTKGIELKTGKRISAASAKQITSAREHVKNADDILAALIDPEAVDADTDIDPDVSTGDDTSAEKAAAPIESEPVAVDHSAATNLIDSIRSLIPAA